MVAAAVAGTVALTVADTPDTEIAATPTPVATAAAPTPAPDEAAEALKATPLDVAKVREDPALSKRLHPDAVLLRAWSVPGLEGDVYLTENRGQWCLSVPDPLTDQPQLERGSTCAEPEGTISLTLGAFYVAVVAEPARTPEIRYPDGSVGQVTPAEGGLLVLTDLPEGGSVALFSEEGRPRLDGVPLRCDDGRLLFPEIGLLPDPALCDTPPPTPRPPEKARP